MEELIEILKQISIGAAIEWIILLAGVIGTISASSIKIYNLAQKWRKAENEKEKQEGVLMENRKNITILENKIDTLICTFKMFVEEDKKDKQTLFRNNIQNIYNITLKKRYITVDDKKNYTYLITAYTRNDGNSYILEDVMPWMKEVPVFSSDEDAEKYYKEHGTYN